MFAQLDRAMIAKRLRDARRNKTRRGQHANGPAPFGWRTHDGELFPVPGEQATLDYMRELRADGLRQADIAAALNDVGLPSRNGGPWTQPVVSRILARDSARSAERIAYENERLTVHDSESLTIPTYA